MQCFRGHGCEFLDGANADLQMLRHLGAVELRCHARKLQLAMQRLVGDAEQVP